MATIRELTYGAWLDESLPEDVRRDVESLCHLLVHCVTDAVVSLMLFEQAYVRDDRSWDTSEEAWRREAERRQQAEAVIRASETAPDDPDARWDWDSDVRDRASREALRMKWAEEGGPQTCRDRLVFIHARSFVSTLALLRRGLEELTRYDLGEANAVVTQALGALDTALPGVKPVRDSAEHREDRVRGKAYGKPLDLQPVMNSMVHAPGGGVLIVESLNNRSYGGTIADGSHAEVEVSDEATEVARAVVQAVLDAMPWRDGHRIWEPGR